MLSEIIIAKMELFWKPRGALHKRESDKQGKWERKRAMEITFSILSQNIFDGAKIYGMLRKFDAHWRRNFVPAEWTFIHAEIFISYFLLLFLFSLILFHFLPFFALSDSKTRYRVSTEMKWDDVKWISVRL